MIGYHLLSARDCHRAKAQMSKSFLRSTRFTAEPPDSARQSSGFSSAGMPATRGTPGPRCFRPTSLYSRFSVARQVFCDFGTVNLSGVTVAIGKASPCVGAATTVCIGPLLVFVTSSLWHDHGPASGHDMVRARAGRPPVGRRSDPACRRVCTAGLAAGGSGSCA